MKKNKIASTLIEAVVVVIIVSVGLITIYGTFIKAREFLDSVSNKIIAVEIAREGIEAMENIRNTNWLRFPGNYENCWDTYNYDEKCLNKATWTNMNETQNGKKINGLYKISLINNIWYLQETGNNNLETDFKTATSREKYLIYKGKDNFYCQKINISANIKNTSSNGDCNGNKPLKQNFTRQIKIERPTNEKSYKMIVRSKVMWAESGRTRQIEIVNLLTNYKEN